jgi:HK97 family phage portal protein
MSEERIMSDIVWTPERGVESPEVRSIAWNNFLLSDEMFQGQWRTAAEIRITPETALASTVVLACCRILAETISSLPLHVMRRSENGGASPAADIPLYKVLSFAPNEWQTKFEFFEQMVMNLTLWGNSYSLIRSGRYGAVSALDNLHPSRMDVERLENGRLRYSYTNPETGRLERYTQDQVMHIRWTAEPDGIKGMVPIEIAREAIALARACEIHASKYWANSARPGVVLQTDNSLSPEAAERLRDNWERLHRGSDRAHRTAILTNGLRVEQVGFNAEQSQFLDSRRFQSEEIARVYRLPISLVQGQSSGNMEATGQEFVTYTLVPWLRRIESGISRSLIYNDDVFFAEFDTKALMRANSNARAAFYSTMQNLGIYSINDSRHDEGLPPIEHGDKHFVAMNMIPLEQAVKGPQQQDPMAAMMGGGPPPEMPGAKPSLPGVKDGHAPPEAPKGEASEKKPLAEGDVVTWGDGKIGELKHIMGEGTLDLKSGEKVEVKPGEPVALVVDPKSGEEFAVKVAELQKAKPAEAVEQRRLSPQNQALYDAQEGIVREKGRWSQADAHYQERNPFASRGIHCRNCVYYEEGGSCEIVKGSIRPDAICKLWIIPDERLSIPEQREGEPEHRDDCGRQKGGQFGPKNQCQESAGEAGSESAASDTGRRPESEAKTGASPIAPATPKPPPVSPVDVQKLIEKISQSPDGFTLDPLSAEQPADGIMVSEFANDSRRSVKIKAEEIKSPSAARQLGEWLANNSDLIGSDPSRFIGGWKTGDDFYIDIATRFDEKDAEKALEAGRGAGQLAVFNLKTFKETWVKYEPEDSRKPAEWDAGFSRARKDSAVKQVYESESPDLQDEDHADELAKHGKKTVRAYDETSKETRSNGRRKEGSAVRRTDSGPESAGDVPRDEGILREGGRGKGGETRSRLVRGRPRVDALAPQRAQAGLIATASRAMGSKMPRVEVRDIGEAIAVYDHRDDVLLVSPTLPDELQAGYASQANPYIHEAAHRIHARANPQSYEAAAAVEFSAEQRQLIGEEVSAIAAIDGREFVAEVLAGILAGKKYGHDILSLAREVAGSEVIP